MSALTAYPAVLSHEATSIFDIVQSRIANHKDNGNVRPYITLSYAQSLDGSIATKDKRQLHLSNQYSLQFTHVLRAIHSAIVVGIGTVLSDNPRLTVRLSVGTESQSRNHPQPIVIDKWLNIPIDSKLVKENELKPIIIINDEIKDDDRLAKIAQLIEYGCEIISFPAIDKEGNIDLKQVFKHFKTRFDSIMIEGGAKLISSCLQSPEIIDSIIVTIAPIYVGGYSIIQKKFSSPFPRLNNVDICELHGDIIIRGDVNQ
jgi:riboflavin-specific deaminase-like protein